MLARLRGTTLTNTPTHDTDDEAGTAGGMFFSDDLPEVERDVQPDYSPARERMLERYLDERDQPVETGE